MELLRVENISKTFTTNRRTVEAVKNVSFSIDKGTTYGLIGESGSGKTTLGSMISLLKKPDSGEIYFCGKDISQLKGKELKEFRRKVQIIFQNPYESLNPRMKAGKIIEEPLLIHNIAKSKEERIYLVNEMRTMCGLDRSSLDKYPYELSGGQRQRISIASSMILKPELVILDEAVSSLDVLIQAQILNLLKLMQKSFGLTYFFISHNLNVTGYLADYIGIMHKGSLIEQGKTEEIIKNPKEDYTKKLFDSVMNV